MTVDPEVARMLLTSELLQLIDDAAALLQNPRFYGIQLARSDNGRNPGLAFRDRVIARLNEMSPRLETPAAPRRNSRRGDLVVPTHVVRKANEALRKLIARSGWPTDYWNEFVPGEWDLNVHQLAKDLYSAAIYRVVDGQTDTTCWWEIYRTAGWGTYYRQS